jgi:hypothetical protein
LDSGLKPLKTKITLDMEKVKELLPDGALLLSGLEAGALLFVSAVSTRYVAAARDEDLNGFFSLWWPFGRDLMAPLGLAAAATNAAAACYESPGASKNAHIAASLTALGIIGWTVGVMGEDIDGLCHSTAADTRATGKEFCSKHHVRAIAAIGAFGSLIYARK